ncbi:MAG: type II secretion system F family protein, partial [Pseudomonadales bacterium]
MAAFQFKAMDASGHIVTGQLEADHITDLEARLGRQKRDLIRGKEKKPGRNFSRQRKPKRHDLINFCYYLEQLVRAGVPLIDALKDLRDSLERGRFQEIIAGVIEKIEEGNKFSEALSFYPEVFSPSFVSLIDAGEQSGEMETVLQDLIKSLKWQDEL